MHPWRRTTLALAFLLPAFLAPIPARTSTFLAGMHGREPIHSPTRFWKQGGVDVLHYRFRLILSDDSNRIEGDAELTVKFLSEGNRELALDLVEEDPGSGLGMQVEGVWEDGIAAEFTHGDGRLILSLASPPAAQEVRTFRVAYGGTPADGLIVGVNLHGNRTFFGDNWPDRARHWLPTVDHPGDKATVEWEVQAPSGYRVVANGMLLGREDMGEDRASTRWASSVALPTKVMVVGVADFAVDTLAIVDGIPVESWVYPEDRERGRYDFALAENALRFLQELVGPFPFEKLANVQSTTRYGGMENASAIFYAERAVRGDRRNESLIVHETAHQWFGDSVTEADWPHIWLSEGFATYLTHLYREETYGREALAEGMEADRRTVARFHSARPGLPLIPVGLTDPEEMLNQNAYQKGAWVLHMLRREMGDEAFRGTLREFYRQFRDRNASTTDFQAVAEEESGADLDWFFRQWAREAGHPQLGMEWSFDSGEEEITIVLRQVQEDGTVFRFSLDLAAEFRDGSLISLGTVQVTEREQVFSFPLASQPFGVVLDPETWLLFEEARRPGG